MSEDEFKKDARNIIPPELLNNIGVLRLELSISLKQVNAEDY